MSLQRCPRHRRQRSAWAPSHCRSISESSIMINDNSVLKSIFSKASDISPPLRHVDSSVSAMWHVMYRHSRHLSARMSFSNFDSFDSARHGFKISDSQLFYPPLGTRRNYQSHGRHESVFGISLVSSHGRALDYGLPDPFNYGLPSLPECPSSEDMPIMSSTIDDTFRSSIVSPVVVSRAMCLASTLKFHSPCYLYSSSYRNKAILYRLS